MLRVLRHYLPLRRALLVFSETVLLTVVLAAGMSAHLLDPSKATLEGLVNLGLSIDAARWRCAISAFLLTVLSQVAISFNELYNFRISTSRYDRASRFVGSAGSAILVALAAVVFARAVELKRVLDFPPMPILQLVQTLVFTMLLGFGLMYLWRGAFHFVLRKWNFSARVLILGAGEQARSLAKEILERPDSGFEVVGMLPEAPLAPRDDGPSETNFFLRSSGLAALAPAAHAGNGSAHGGNGKSNGSHAETAAAPSQALLLEPIPAVATLAEEPEAYSKPLSEPLFELVERLGVDVVAVALQDRRGHLPVEELLRCRLAGIAVKEREALYELITGRIAVEALRPSYLIFNDGFGRTPQGELAKRLLDVTLAALGIVLTWPVMLATAIIVRFDSPGPVLFTQERVGRDGKNFTLYKFRSMRADAEAKTGAVWAQKDDPRITRAGRFLRKTRLDELPQLFNVLAGDMSLVGPRPERPMFVNDLTRQIPYYGQRHIVTPGLTGWAQINYPYGNTVQDSLQKLQYDLFYIKYQSWLFDLSILFNTIKTVVLRRGT
ncbi:MAG: TIGR03013 family PEP-CTERM/XrtA system glycosyltransferase [Planctomycetes bacterium]|nr:TIGR03013 family PEP-CTERM/XrtA system glycosyltransferase [Planctomycetota bacterium]